MKVRIIKEVYSNKQRRFFCASDKPELKAMCDDPMKEALIAEPIDKDYLKQQGIILLKDVFDYWNNGVKDFSIQKILRKSFFIPETMRIMELLKELQKSKKA